MGSFNMERSWLENFQQSGDVAPPGVSVLHIGGIHGNVDRDLFSGTLDDFKAFALSLYTAPAADQSPPETVSQIIANTDPSQLEIT